eukprot:7447339-Alexandrium_andersonii.AAC.1
MVALIVLRPLFRFAAGVHPWDRRRWTDRRVEPRRRTFAVGLGRQRKHLPWPRGLGRRSCDGHAVCHTVDFPIGHASGRAGAPGPGGL